MKFVPRYKGLVLLLGLLLLGALFQGDVGAAHWIAASPSDIRVWLPGEADVYSCDDELVFCVRAARDCYATVFLVDTDGFIHVVYPFSPVEDAFLRGGVVYRFSSRGMDVFSSPSAKGIAYVYAVASPVPFCFAEYGVRIFGGPSSYRICGDPFIGCRKFYLSILPPFCDFGMIGVSFSSFYIRGWARYPRYLCRGCHHAGLRFVAGAHCSDFYSYYQQYRFHADNPYLVLNPVRRLRPGFERLAGVSLVSRNYKQKKTIAGEENGRGLKDISRIRYRKGKEKIGRERAGAKTILSKGKSVKGNKRPREKARSTYRSTIEKRRSKETVAKVVKKRRAPRGEKKRRAIRRQSP